AVALLIVAPAVLLVSALMREAPQFADRVKESSENAPQQIQRIWDAVRSRSPFAMPDDPTAILTNGTSRALAFLKDRAGTLVTDSLATLGGIVAMLFALFFLLR